MFIRQHSVVVEAPAAAIYDYVSDLARHPEWAAQPMRMSMIGKDRAHSKVDFKGIPIEAEVWIVEDRRPSRFAYECKDLNGHYRWTFELEPAGMGTRSRTAWSARRARSRYAWCRPG